MKDKPYADPIPVAEVTHTPERMLKHFDFTKLSGQDRVIAIFYSDTASNLCYAVPASAERTVALRKLLESRDAALRCVSE